MGAALRTEWTTRGSIRKALQKQEGEVIVREGRSCERMWLASLNDSMRGRKMRDKQELCLVLLSRVVWLGELDSTGQASRVGNLWLGCLSLSLLHQMSMQHIMLSLNFWPNISTFMVSNNVFGDLLLTAYYMTSIRILSEKTKIPAHKKYPSSGIILSEHPLSTSIVIWGEIRKYWRYLSFLTS